MEKPQGWRASLALPFLVALRRAGLWDSGSVWCRGSFTPRCGGV